MYTIRKMNKEELEVWTKNRDEQREKLLSTFGNREGKTTLREYCLKNGISQSE